MQILRTSEYSQVFGYSPLPYLTAVITFRIALPENGSVEYFLALIKIDKCFSCFLLMGLVG